MCDKSPSQASCVVRGLSDDRFWIEFGSHAATIRQHGQPADFLVLTGSLWRAYGNADANSGRMLEGLSRSPATQHR
jgi:hypothetical protein